MIFTSAPPDGPARRAWSIFSVLLGHVLEMRFKQEHNGDLSGFWRVRYYDADTGKEQVKYFPVESIDAVHYGLPHLMLPRGAAASGDV